MIGGTINEGAPPAGITLVELKNFAIQLGGECPPQAAMPGQAVSRATPATRATFSTAVHRSTTSPVRSKRN